MSDVSLKPGETFSLGFDFGPHKRGSVFTIIQKETEMGFHIIGAGMAGLLAGALLRDEAAAIYEMQPALPHNHKALLRFRSAIVSDSLGIPFTNVNVIKEVEGGTSEIAANLRYGRKVTGQLSHRSVFNTRRSEVVERYIAPDDFVERLAKKVMCPIKYNSVFWTLARESYEPVISTMPMPALMDHLQYTGPRPEFRSVPGITVTARLHDVHAYATMYATSDRWKFYRVSITGDTLIIEYAFPGEAMVDVSEEFRSIHEDISNSIADAMDLLGLDEVRYDGAEATMARYQKIAPVDESLRRQFLIWASDNHNVYSLGRFATWRPGLMMDDLVNDVRQIKMLAKRNGANFHERMKG